jgi:hypothetical protein
MYVPPQYHVVHPELSVMRRAAAKAIADSESARQPTPTASAGSSVQPSGAPSATPDPSGGASASPDQHKNRAVSLTTACG